MPSANTTDIANHTTVDFTLKRAIKSFADSLAALRDFVAVLGSVLDARQTELLKSRGKDFYPVILALEAMKATPGLKAEAAQGIKGELGDKVSIELEENGKRCKIELRDEALQKNLLDAMKSLNSESKHQELLYRSALISLISSAEWFVSQVIRQHLADHPEAVDNKTLTLKDLKGLNSVSDAQQLLIDSRVDDIIRGSFEDWLKYVKESLRLSAAYLDEQRDSLVEIFQRRNVMVHNNGVVNPVYLGKVRLDLRTGWKIGEQMIISPEYLSNSINLIEANFVLIGAEVWKKLRPDDEDRASVLIDLAFEHLTESRWEIAERLSDFLQRDKKLSERSQIIGQLNFWQCKKWRERFDEVKAEIDAADFSAKDEVYQLARFALLDDTEKFFEMVPVLLRNKKLSFDHLNTWPIFRSMRSREEYRQFLDKAGPELGLGEVKAIEPPSAAN